MIFISNPFCINNNNNNNLISKETKEEEEVNNTCEKMQMIDDIVSYFRIELIVYCWQTVSEGIKGAGRGQGCH